MQGLPGILIITSSSSFEGKHKSVASPFFHQLFSSIHSRLLLSNQPTTTTEKPSDDSSPSATVTKGRPCARICPAISPWQTIVLRSARVMDHSANTPASCAPADLVDSSDWTVLFMKNVIQANSILYGIVCAIIYCWVVQRRGWRDCKHPESGRSIGKSRSMNYFVRSFHRGVWLVGCWEGFFFVNI